MVYIDGDGELYVLRLTQGRNVCWYHCPSDPARLAFSDGKISTLLIFGNRISLREEISYRDSETEFQGKQSNWTRLKMDL